MNMWPAVAAVLESPEATFTLQPVELGPLASGEVLDRVLASGVCGTDMEARELTPTPSVLGHEGVGIVEELGPDVTGVVPGDLVVMSYPSCGDCAGCLRDTRWLCENNWSLSFDGNRGDGSRPVLRDGVPIASAYFQQSSFSTRAIVPARSLVLAPSDIPLPVLAALPCGVLTGVGAVLNVLKVSSGDSLAVIGTGAVGLAAIMAAKILGATTIVAIDVHPGRLELSRQLGATHSISALGQSVPEAILQQIPEGIRAVLDTTGRQSSWSDAVTYLQRGGDFAFVTTPEPVETYGFPPFPLFLKCGSLHTVLLGGANAQDTLSTIFAWYRQGEFPVDDIVRTYAFEDIELAFEHSIAGETIKPVLLMP